MKFNIKRALSLFLTIIYITAFFPSVSFAEGDLLSCDFEDESSLDLWLGAVRDTAFAFDGDWGINVVNPYGDEAAGIYGHILEHRDYLHLEEGKCYTFSMAVMNPLTDSNAIPTASAYIGRNGTELFIDISSIGFEWNVVTASFIATETVDVPLVITFEDVTLDVGVFVDNITISPESRVPEYTVLEGPESVFVPESGYADYRYSIVTYGDDSLPINILISDPAIAADHLPDGVEFYPPSGKLRVHSTAEKDISFTLSCVAFVGDDLFAAQKTVTTTKNALTADSLTAGEQYWDSPDGIDFSNGYAELYASERGSFGYCTTMTYTKQLFLYGGHMYVFHADVGSDPDFPASSVYISNLSFAQSGYAEINITGVGGEWGHVTSAFMIESTGFYDFTINLHAPTPRPIYIDNLYLGVEEVAPTSISIHAPGHVQLPSGTTILPCYSTVRNQLGEAMDDYYSSLSISPENEGVYLEDGNIIVTHGAREGDYEITASFEDITTLHVVTVSSDAVGDGGFEEKQANEWWTASDGAIFSIIDYKSDKYGSVLSDDSTCLVINNSYMELLQGNTYVYSAEKGRGNATITAFIDDHDTGEFIPFAQYKLSEDAKVPFSFEKDVTGRLVLYVESEDEIDILFDNISITSAELTVTDVLVTGGGYGDFLKGKYVYVNNMTDASDADISSTRFYISSSIDGHYEPIGIPNQSYLPFTADMAGQYIIYEVTPVCSYSGLVGAPVRSEPVKISDVPVLGEDTQPPQISVMAPIEIESADSHPFMDISAHWAESMIASLAASGVISGRENNRFVPEDNITRAEFVSMVARAFSLVSIPYSGAFTDVSAENWHSGWIEAVYTRNIVKGVTSTLFAPDKFITREEMATILSRAYILAEGHLPYEINMTYYDEFRISPWAYDSVKLCTNLNIFRGDDLNLFNPQDYATRAEAAACIYRTLTIF